MNSLLDEIRSLVIVAPHPDDEVLGCGGLIALAREKAITVTLIFVSDGTGSHPGSPTYPPKRLAWLRSTEAITAAALLGVPRRAIEFLDLRDTAVPQDPNKAEFRAAAGRIARILEDAEANVLAVTHRDEPHCDHRACHCLARSAAATTRDRSIRILEYRIWLPVSAPLSADAMVHSVDISAVLDRKRAAIACYRSQTTDLIADDPGGFRLSSADIARFSRPLELFEECKT